MTRDHEPHPPHAPHDTEASVDSRPNHPDATDPPQQGNAPDWSRFEVAGHHLGELITAGLTQALETHLDVDSATARLIARVLSRSLGPTSALAEFAHSGEGDYETLREEYLQLRNDPGAPPCVSELIDWLGAHLIHRHYPDASTTTYTKTCPPRLADILVPTDIHVGKRELSVHVPGIYPQASIDELTHTLTDLDADRDDALRAFLSLPDVNAMSGDIMGDFDQQYVGTFASVEDALDDVADTTERERVVTECATRHDLIIDQMTPDYEALLEKAADGFDFVEKEDLTYVFSK